MASSIGSSSGWGVTMIAVTVDRTLAVFVPGWVLDDGSLAPPARGDVVEVVLSFHPTGQTPSPCRQTVRATGPVRRRRGGTRNNLCKAPRAMSPITVREITDRGNVSPLR